MSTKARGNFWPSIWISIIVSCSIVLSFWAGRQSSVACGMEADSWRNTAESYRRLALTVIDNPDVNTTVLREAVATPVAKHAH